MIKKVISVCLLVMIVLLTQIGTAHASEPLLVRGVNVSWDNALSLPSKRNAYIAGKAYAPSTVSFSAASFMLWDKNGSLVASTSETLSITGSSVFLYYDIYKDSGVLLQPSTEYTYKLTISFDGSTYDSPIYTFTTESENDSHFGIDVSSHQGRINWETAASYVDFAIIRCGYGEDNTAYDDQYWEYNASECERLGIPYGVYLYSYAENNSEADSEANHVLRLLGNHHPSLPVYYDLEDNDTVGKQSNAQIESQANIFCNKMSAAGYDVGVYASLDWWNNRLTSSTYDRFHKWIAAYGNYNLLSWEKWQYSSSGRVPGISGNVDLDYSRENVLPEPAHEDPTEPAHEDPTEPTEPDVADTQLVIQNRTVVPGETVTVPLVLEDAIQAKSISLSGIIYDDESLELIGGEWKLGNSVTESWNAGNHTGSISFANNTYVSGVVFELTFKIKNNAEKGDYFIHCDATAKRMNDSGVETTVIIPTVAGTIHIADVIRGDVDGDHIVTSDDAIHVLYFTLIPDMYPVNQSVDFDGDGMITSDDAIYLLYNTLIPDLYPLH